MKEEEHGIEPENRTVCPATEGLHQWMWDEEKDEYFCDECCCSEENQEDYMEEDALDCN